VEVPGLRARRRASPTPSPDVVADQPSAVDRWHLLSDMTVFYERGPSEFEEARVLTSVTLRDRLLRIEGPTRPAGPFGRPSGETGLRG